MLHMNEIVRCFFFGCFWVMLGWRDEHQTNMFYFLLIYFFTVQLLHLFWHVLATNMF
jgi:hypothetical protein